MYRKTDLSRKYWTYVFKGMNLFSTIFELSPLITFRSICSDQSKAEMNRLQVVQRRNCSFLSH